MKTFDVAKIAPMLNSAPRHRKAHWGMEEYIMMDI